MDLALISLATIAGIYGLWYGAFAGQFAARHPWTGRVKYRYKPSLFQRIMVVAAGLLITICGIAQIARMLKPN